MFKFLKDKLKEAVSIFSKKAEEEEGAVTREEAPQQEREESFLKEQPEKTPESQVSENAPDEVPQPAAEPAQEKPADSEPKPEVQETAADSHIIADEQQARAQEEQTRLDEEAARKAEHEAEQRRLEQERLSEEARRKEEEKARVAEQARLAEEANRRRQEEQERLEDERRKQEELRLEEEARKKADEEKERAEQKEKPGEYEEKKSGFFSRLFGRKEEKPITPVQKPQSMPKPKIILDKEEFERGKEVYSVKEEDKPEPVKKEEEKPAPGQDKPADEPEEKKGLFGMIKESLTTVKLSDEKFNDLFWDLEVTMLENNVAVEVIEKIKEDLRAELTTGKVSRKTVDQIVHDTLKKSIEELFDGAKAFDLVERIRSSGRKPYVIAFIGVNGSGKTTTMAKVANLLVKNNLSVVFAASDTFRAAAIQQLQEHADKLGVKMIRHDYESDPAAVAFDAVKHAQAKGLDVVLIDTAGRLHTNDNLMNELKKLIRVNSPDLKVFIGESITGNDCVEQAKLFNEAVGIDAIILAKTDIDEKGGAALSVSYVTGKPIIYLGTGQAYDDLQKFDQDLIVKNIGL